MLPFVTQAIWEGSTLPITQHSRNGNNKQLSTCAGSIVVRAAATRDPSKRVVITGIGLCSVFGNDPDTFYNK